MPPFGDAFKKCIDHLGDSGLVDLGCVVKAGSLRSPSVVRSRRATIALGQSRTRPFCMARPSRPVPPAAHPEQALETGVIRRQVAMADGPVDADSFSVGPAPRAVGGSRTHHDGLEVFLLQCFEGLTFAARRRGHYAAELPPNLSGWMTLPEYLLNGSGRLVRNVR